MASSEAPQEDKYRSYLHGDGEKNTRWRFGSAPNYDLVNELFEQGRTKVSVPLCNLVTVVQTELIAFINVLGSDDSLCEKRNICCVLSTDMAAGISRGRSAEPRQDMGDGDVPQS